MNICTHKDGSISRHVLYLLWLCELDLYLMMCLIKPLVSNWPESQWGFRHSQGFHSDIYRHISWYITKHENLFSLRYIPQTFICFQETNHMWKNIDFEMKKPGSAKWLTYFKVQDSFLHRSIGAVHKRWCWTAPSSACVHLSPLSRSAVHGSESVLRGLSTEALPTGGKIWFFSWQGYWAEQIGPGLCRVRLSEANMSQQAGAPRPVSSKAVTCESVINKGMGVL